MSETIFKKDKLVLYFEEDASSLDDVSEIRCYVVYDETEKEYFIAGKKNEDDAKDFNFYCKTRKDIYKFLTHLIDKDSKINITLYNFSNIYDNAPYHYGEPYLNYDYLNLCSNNEVNEIVTYCDCLNNNYIHSERNNYLITLLKMLKTVRY
jgi:hypothetical protein